MKPDNHFYTNTTQGSLRRYAKGKGREISDEYAALVREWKDAQPVLTRCAFCDWFHTGTLAEGREKHAQHRTEHPEARTGKKPVKPSMIPGSDVDHNIAAVRAQGGHHWDEVAA